MSPYSPIISRFCLLALFAIYSNTFFAQQLQQFATSTSSHDSLSGFNENTVIAEFNSLGLPQDLYNEFLASKKREYINTKYNILNGEFPISDPYNPPYSEDGHNVIFKKKGGAPPTTQAYCNNVDFETGNFAGWIGKTGTFTSCAVTCPTTGFVFGRHTIMSGAGFDPIIGAPLKMVAPGGAFSLRLGNSSVGAQAESIEQTFNVQANATSFTYRYAVVLHDPVSGHTNIEPSFRIEIFNTATGALIPCAQYYVRALPNNPGFNKKTVPSYGDVYWKDWTTVNVDLSGFVGQNVTVRFTTRDCNAGGHFGYAYLDGDCLGIQLTQSDTLCQGSLVTIAAPAGSASYSWDPGGQTTSSINVGTAGTYTVTMTSVQGCITKSFIGVNIHPRPNASFNTVQGVCSSSIQFNDGSSISSGTIADWRWTFGTPNNDSSHVQSPGFNYTTPGTYTVGLIVTSAVGCKDTLNTIVAVPNTPTINFNNTTACLGDATQFTDLSAVNPGSMTGWQWNFGEPSSGANNTSTQQNPTHTYATAGTFWVTLIATTNQGCYDSIRLPVIVNAIPIPNFVGNTVCEGVGTKFTDASYANPGAVTGWSWAFGDGNTSTLRNPTHTYATAGTYAATLIATSNGGCTATISKNITVNPLPTAQFTASAACLGSPTQFTDNSIITAGTVTGWKWDFGDPGSGASNTSNLPNPTHTYSAAGNYVVNLIATSNKGCQGTATQTITVHPPADPDFTVTSVCLNNPSTFTDASTVPTGNIVGWQWDFGEPASGANNTSNATNPQHTYSNCGSFNASLIITTSYGCQALVILPVNVNCLPSASFNTANACENTPVSFNNTTSIFSGTVVSYSWNFGDPGSGANNTSTLTSPTHVFSGSGAYVISLTAVSDSGCQASFPQNVNIDPKPVAAFTGGPECAGTAVAFTDQSNIASGAISQWTWDFADPASGAANTSIQQNPSHTYTASGVYAVTLIAGSASGCMDTIVQNVIINPAPTASISVTETCFGEAAAFTDHSTIGGGGTIAGYLWDFGDPASGAANNDTQQNPTHVYSAPGVYSASLIITSSDGCTSIAVVSATVNPTPTPSFTNNTVCLGIATQFNNTSAIASGNITNYSWNFGDGSGTSNQQSPSYTYGVAGDYNVTLVLTSDKGCKDSIQKTITVYDNPVVNFIADDTAGCVSHCVQFTDSSSVSNGNITGWLWEFGDGETSTIQNPLHCYTMTGVFSVTLTVTTNNNCQTTYVKNNYITVHPVPVADFTAQPQPTTILNPLILFTDQSVGADKWYWYFGDGDSAVFLDQTPSHEYKDTGTYVVRLIVENEFGCRDTIDKNVIIGPDFIFYIPNAFTPNGDNKNETFFAVMEGVTEFEMWIYDRWGNQIWNTDDINAQWDGRANEGSQQAQQDVYVWVIRCKDIFEKKHKFVGKVTLIR